MLGLLAYSDTVARPRVTALNKVVFPLLGSPIIPISNVRVLWDGGCRSQVVYLTQPLCE